ncbi:exosome complex exonuclease Rrp41 [Methanosalsum natronophilum]|nr:exosome complex exonuclease Rrp41 [Methanosalsum natronophilum]MCS3924058.1 exosome complex component RRP41 [Methanosalsum natronophilum]
MSDKPDKFIDDDGLRLDGRRFDEIRPMKIEIGVLSRADGSCYLEWGKNKILAAVYGPRTLHPRRKQIPDAALIRYRYNMASFSVEERVRPGPSRRSVEISKVSAEAFEPVVLTKYYPNTVIDVFTEVLQADAGTRTAAINAASLALADAGIPMQCLVSACAVGKVDGKLVLDLNKEEDNFGDADLPVAMTQDGEVTLLQMDGNLTPDELKESLEMLKKGCTEIFEIQKKALYTKFGKDPVLDVDDIDDEDDEGLAQIQVELDDSEGEDVELDEDYLDVDEELEEAVEVIEVEEDPDKKGISNLSDEKEDDSDEQ